ncbi:virion structural protein [Pseudomonas phage PaMx11]|uniref:Virion structural protein n=1 Tax=Pseudomonas phage PaMx11 TaxID=1175657 RepID=A0A0S0N5B2_BPPAM|nr:structural protein [Pseudomonas phage PaMx11]ALH23700.1 virion structural protein [Pseudomonas phage PaMx11]
MANEVGTAANLEDLFGKIVSFLTTSPALVAANQDWEVLRVRRDNVAVTTNNLFEPSTATHRKTFHTFRYDNRSINTSSPTASLDSHFYSSGFVAGTSFVQWQLKVAKEVKSVRLRCPRTTTSTYVNSMIRNFRLQWSDDGSSWTTALTVNSSPVYSVGEEKIWPVSGTPGAHAYWRIVIDSVPSGSAVGWDRMLLLTDSGEVANHFGSEVILRAPGNSGSESIYVGIRSEYDEGAGWHNLFLNGYTGFDPNEESWFDQPGALPGFGQSYTYAVPMVPCWNAAMPYWFVASGRSFRFGVKVSTNYEGGYLGFILPYATPGQYPYPLAVGGSLVPQETLRSAEWRYSYANWRHGVYPGPGAPSDPTSENRWATLYLRNPDGEWGYFANRPNSSNPAPEQVQSPDVSLSAPYTPTSGSGWRAVWPHCVNDLWSGGCRPYRECLGGGYILQPCIMLQRGPYVAVFGELEGTYAISGYQNAAENTTTWNGKTVVVFQNAYRNTVHEFWALSLD